MFLGLMSVKYKLTFLFFLLGGYGYDGTYYNGGGYGGGYGGYDYSGYGQGYNQGYGGGGGGYGKLY